MYSFPARARHASTDQALLLPVMRDELVPGTLEMLILKAISIAPMHGYAIAQYLQQASQEVLRVEEGSLYPALQRLQAKGWLKSEWKETPNKRRARYYTLTALGRKQLGEEVATYQRISQAIRRILRGAVGAER